MIFFISLAVLKLTSCVPKIADFFLHVLDLGKFSALASTFLAHDDELDKPSFFSIRSSVISNKPTLADIRSFSDTLSLKRWF